MRRSLLLAVLLSLVAAAPASAHHTVLPLEPHNTCGTVSALLDPTETPTPNFLVQGGSDPAAVGAAFEAARARLVDAFAWPAPRSTHPQGLYQLRAGDATGVKEDGSYAAPAEDDPESTCIVFPTAANDDTPEAKAALEDFAAGELAKAIWHRVGSEGDDPAWLYRSAAELMQDEVFPANGIVHATSSAWAQPLATHPGDAGAWLVLRGLTERFGAGAPGGAEDVLLATFEQISAGADGLTALANALTAKGTSLEAAFGDYAIAAKFLKSCSGGYAATPCFAQAAAYTGVPDRASHASVTATDTPYQGTVPAGLALQWIDLPDGPYDVTLTNTGDGDAAGTVTGAIACDTGTALQLHRLGTVALAQSTLTRNVAGCADPVLIVTSDRATGDAREFQLSFDRATTILTILRFGEGLVGSAPAGIECGLVCTAVFELGTNVTLGAQPKLGHTFAGWSGDCSGTAVCAVTLDRDRSVAAGFAPVKAPAGPSAGPGGGSSGDTVAPRMLIAKPRITRGRKKIRLELTCPADEASSCTGPVGLSLRIGKKRYSFDGEALVRLRPGRSRVVSYAFSSSERSRLRRARRVRVTVSVRARDEAFNSLTTTRTYKRVRVPRR